MIELRRADFGDCRRIWEWRNDEATRALSTSGEAIPWETHEAWFKRILSDEDVLLLVGEIGEDPFGVVRFDRDSEACVTVSINLAPAARGRGLGPRLLDAGCREARKCWPDRTLVATIKPHNVASRRAFERVGFVCAQESPAACRYELARGQPGR